MSLSPYGDNQLPTRWSISDFGRYLSFQAHRMYFWLRHIAPVLVKTELKQMERNVINNLPFVSQDGKRDIKRWLGHYDPSHFQGEITNTWVDFDSYKNNQKGMKIYITFNVRNLKDIECRITAYFYFAGGAQLRDFNNSYHTTNGHVATGCNFTPSYDNSVYTDFDIFLPYSELHMADGSHSLCFDIEIYDIRSNTHFASSPKYYNFNYRQG